MNTFIIIGIVFFILGTGLMMASSRNAGRKKWMYIGFSVLSDLIGLFFLLYLGN
ncbi:hypothetical protein M1K46_20495 [Fictibacillus sp. WQ 8-8]|uniref:Uncharacterized protein n=1 Tax=Fictibacillus marinisediminis TaxID=2878389 RepID=A0A9X1XCY2_9BACL|nr:MULTISPECIES: hypothetical protein [Fictibacillus]SFD50758.1 hypothetical protein SAMN05428981_101697 [Bacillus sp. OV194]MCK6258318.1 hypothetical protein [Fictibacillus marinisediminis]MCQ6268004.1 hypothetical protein [Fictibacillus sp. WQ 8-8]MED2971237.1 hypothetical protein [Fictibacillus sp. B-59209]UZJ80055.1 hypothetical protein OKX00_06185 [Fictibacillus sp. KU28468]